MHGGSSPMCRAPHRVASFLRGSSGHIYGFSCAPWSEKLILCKETRKGRESKPRSDSLHQ